MSRRGLSTSISVAVHGLLVTALVVIPLLVSDALPRPSETLHTFLVSAPQVVPPPPPPPPPRPSAVAGRLHEPKTAPSLPRVARFEAPVEIPEKIFAEESLELGLEGGVAGGVGGGVPGGVVGGIVGGLPQIATPLPVVRVGKTIRAPRLLRKIPPEYPPVALKARLSGIVVLDAHVDAQGRVKAVEVLSGHPWFSEAAIAAVKQWRYMPLLLNGEPREFLLSVTVTFNLAVAPH